MVLIYNVKKIKEGKSVFYNKVIRIFYFFFVVRVIGISERFRNYRKEENERSCFLE